MPDFTVTQWMLAILAAAGIGVAKSGFSGVSMLHVLVFASLFQARASTGVVLPMLIVGDIFAVLAFRQHARWEYIRRMLPPAATGVVLGWLLMQHIPDALFKPLIGTIILILTALQLFRITRPRAFEHIPHHPAFAWTMGLLAGITTMLANAAGPIMALYFVALALPKYELVGTSAWFFLVINCFKLPFSAGLGLVDAHTLLFNLVLVPAVGAGLIGGRWLIARVPQRLFDGLLLAFAGVAALRLVGIF